MDNKDLSNWFLSIFNSCYIVRTKQPRDVIGLYYDISYIRHNKLCQIDNKDDKILPDVDKGICLFEIDNLRNIFMCDYNIRDYLINNGLPDERSALMFIFDKLNDIKHFRTYNVTFNDVKSDRSYQYTFNKKLEIKYKNIKDYFDYKVV